MTQNVIVQVKSHVTKHEFWGLLVLKSQHPMLPNLTWNETWNDTSWKKLGDYLILLVFGNLCATASILLCISKGNLPDSLPLCGNN